MLDRNISGTDKFISAGTYITGGLLGIIWQIFCAISRKIPSRFLMFNIFQSVFLSIFLFFVNLILSFTVQLLLFIPFVNRMVNSIVLKLLSPIYYNWSIVSLIIFVIYLYLVVFAISGKYAYIPWVSKIITYHIDRY